MGPIEALQCWAFSETDARTDYYTSMGWLTLGEVKLLMALGQKFQVARSDSEGNLKDGAPLELHVQTKGNRKGWDNLKTLQKKHRG